MTVRWDADASASALSGIAAGAFTTAQATAAGIDTQGYGKCAIVVSVGTITDGTITTSITEAATLSGSYTAVAAALLSTAFTGFTSATDETAEVVFLDLAGAERFIKVLFSETDASAGYDMSAVVLLFDKVDVSAA